MPIYTRKGDKGETSLFGGKRVGKDCACLGVCGSIDELNSLIGLALSEIEEEDVRGVLKQLQVDLFWLGADLATPGGSKRITQEHTARLESTIEKFEGELQPLHKFIMPRGTRGASLLHVCRTVCRRAERDVVELSKEERINTECMAYLNRLSSLLFELARVANA